MPKTRLNVSLDQDLAEFAKDRAMLGSNLTSFFDQKISHKK